MAEDVNLYPHGDRWALCEGPECNPISEFATRAEAEMAANQLARERGVEVIVRDDDPTGLAEVQEPGAGEPLVPDRSVEGGAAKGGVGEHLREQQAGF